MARRGRPKIAQNVAISPWLSAKKDCREGRFLQVGNSLLLSEEFQTLKDSAKFLYFCMALECGGRPEFEFPLSTAKKYGIPGTTFRRVIQDLINGHFIEVISSGKTTREPNDYRFISEWKHS